MEAWDGGGGGESAQSDNLLELVVGAGCWVSVRHGTKEKPGGPVVQCNINAVEAILGRKTHLRVRRNVNAIQSSSAMLVWPREGPGI